MITLILPTDSMCMDRAPEVAFLWAGATVLGLQKRLLKDVRRGQVPSDFESAAWSGTTQSFIHVTVWAMPDR
jgi:hypothetical protein